MFNTKFIRHVLATASLALGLAAAPVALSAHLGLTSQAAAAKEAESGGKHSEPGDKRGNKSRNDDRAGDKSRNDDVGGDKRGGKSQVDDNPGAHNQNGKRK